MVRKLTGVILTCAVTAAMIGCGNNPVAFVAQPENGSLAKTGTGASLTNWETTIANQTVAPNSFTEHTISTDIPANRIVILSLTSSSNNKPLALSLINTSGTQPVKASYGGWYTPTKMTYYKTRDNANKRYKVRVTNSSSSSISYSVAVYVMNTTSFVKTDTKGYASSNKTYCISNAPEFLSATANQGQDGYYLQRSIVQGNANVYWEHVNTSSASVKFGVLLYNKSGASVTVTLNRRSYESAAQGKNPTLKTWVDWFNGEKQSDASGVSTTVTIPNNEARWICLYTVGNGLFNGVVDMSIPSGKSLFCDTYVMGTGTKNNQSCSEYTRLKAASNSIVPSPKSTLRGSGMGAILSSSIGATTISSGNPYRLAITGYDMPELNSGELVSIYDKDNRLVQSNSCNFGNIYNLSFSSLNSTATIKGQVKYNPKVNPNYSANSSGGIYVIVRRYCGGVWATPYSVLLLNNSNTATFDTNVPKGKSVQYYIVASGMSSLPLEVSFSN